ncbi:Alpha/Beta hydrolase protein [Auriculariales sp. MPI-PUGE-AT-0066]|nr:Alpha/Beta hydrolase protein [Auriculariales sp. MPI-PUGE-AT-0066]
MANSYTAPSLWHPLLVTWRYIRMTLSMLTLIFLIPIWALCAFHPSWRPRRAWKIRDVLLVKVLRTVLGAAFATGIFPGTGTPDEPAHDASAISYPDILDGRQVWINPLSSEDLEDGDPEVLHAMRVNDVAPAKVRAFWFSAPGLETGSEKKIKLGRVMIYFHGGGFVSGTAAPKKPGSAEGLARHLVQAGARSSAGVTHVLSVDYRLACGPPFAANGNHANPFPAPLLDALSAYLHVTNDLGVNARDIIMCGDSAGGQIALGVALWIVRSRTKKLGLPGALVLLSPMVDYPSVEDASPGSSLVRNAATDFSGPILEAWLLRQLCAWKACRGMAERLSVHLARDCQRSEDTDLTGLPPTCIVAGEAEQMVDSIRLLHEQILCLGVQSKYLEYEDAYHDFISLDGLHSQDALKDIQLWLSKVFH